MKERKEGLREEETARPYHHGDLRNALIEAGLEVLAAEGADGLSLRKVARKAGVSHAAPYRHFADKEALIAAIADEGFHMLAERMTAAIARFPADPRAQLLESGWAYIEFGLEHPDHLRVMFTRLSERRAFQARDSFELLVDTIEACQAAGVVAAGDALELALTSWATVHGMALLLIENKIPPVTAGESTPEQVARACIQRLYDGLRP